MIKRSKITSNFKAKQSFELRRSGLSLSKVAGIIGKTKDQTKELIKIGERLSL